MGCRPLRTHTRRFGPPRVSTHEVRLWSTATVVGVLIYCHRNARPSCASFLSSSIHVSCGSGARATARGLRVSHTSFACPVGTSIHRARGSSSIVLRTPVSDGNHRCISELQRPTSSATRCPRGIFENVTNGGEKISSLSTYKRIAIISGIAAGPKRQRPTLTYCTVTTLLPAPSRHSEKHPHNRQRQGGNVSCRGGCRTRKCVAQKRRRLMPPAAKMWGQNLVVDDRNLGWKSGCERLSTSPSTSTSTDDAST